MMKNDSQPIAKNLQDAIRQIRLVAFDFDGVLTDNMVYVFQDGSEAVRCNRSDGIGLKRLRDLGIETVIISTEANPVVSARAEKLKMRCFQNCSDKRHTLKNVARELDISLKEVAFVGNDVNDHECLTCVRLPIVVQDAHPDVIPLAAYHTRNFGGRGAVREVCDLFEQVLKK
jgi:YrbI family 3-deoxy-D-manno-octulosonate 8-phosphate phosphatase